MQSEWKAKSPNCGKKCSPKRQYKNRFDCLQHSDVNDIMVLPIYDYSNAQEIQDLVASYQRLERIVTAHLQDFQNVVALAGSDASKPLHTV